MSDKELKVSYLIEAVDKASAVVERIDKSLVASNKTHQELLFQIEKLNKARATEIKTITSQNSVLKENIKETNNNVKAQKSLIEKFQQAKDGVSKFIQFMANLSQILANINYKKIATLLYIASAFLRLKGFDKIANFLKMISLNMAKFGIYAAGLDKVGTSVSSLIKEILTFDGVLKALGLDRIFDLFVDVTGSIIGLTAAITGVAIVTPIFNIATKALLKTDGAIGLMAEGFNDASQGATLHLKGMQKVGAFFNKMPNFVQTGFLSIVNFTRNGLMKTTKALGALRNGLIGTITGIKETGSIAKGLVSIFGKAVKHTELFDKGLIGLVTRVGVAGVGFASLGKLLLDSDSVMLKISGMTLLALAAAFGGLAVVVKRFLDVIGGVIQALGTKFVSVAQQAAAVMVDYEAATFSFNRTIVNFNHEFGKSVGTLENWKDTVKDLRKETSVSTRELQLLSVEAIEATAQFGFNEAQMRKLINVTVDYAKQTKNNVLDTMNSVLGAIGGVTSRLPQYGINLTAAAVSSKILGQKTESLFNKMSEAEKAQARFQLLLHQYAPVAGLASAATDTLAERQKLLKATMQDLAAEFGKGAELIENQVNYPLEVLIKTFRRLPDAIVQTSGFFTALAGRLLQLIGIVLKSVFTITLLASTYKALNIVLASDVMGRVFKKNILFFNKSIKEIIKGLGVSKVELTSFGGVARTAFRAMIVSITSTTKALFGFHATTQVTAGLLLQTVGSKIISGFRRLSLAIWGASKAMWGFMVPLLPIIGIVAGVAAIFYVLYKALVEIDKKTKIFTDVWKELVDWWNKSFDVIKPIKKAIKDLATLFSKGLKLGILAVAITIVWLTAKMLKMADDGRTAWSYLKEDLAKMWQWLVKLGSKLKLISLAEAANIQRDIAGEKAKEAEITVKNKKELAKTLEVLASLKKDYTILLNTDIATLQLLEAQNRERLKKLGIEKDYLKMLQDARDAENAISGQNKAKFSLKVREIGAKVGMSGKLSEDVYAGLKAGSAEQIKGAATDALMSSGNPYAQAAGAVIDIFGKDQKEFKKFAKELFKMAADLPIQIAENIPVLIDELVKKAPDIINAMGDAMPAFMDQMTKIVSSPKFWRSMVKAMGASILNMLSRPDIWGKAAITFVGAIIIGFKKAFDFIFNSLLDPSFWGNIIAIVADVIIQWIPKIFNFIKNGISAVLMPPFNFIANMFKSVGNVFKDVLKLLGKLISKVKDALNPVKKVKSVVKKAKGVVNKVKSFFGFENGGIPALNAMNLVRAQNGIASVAGNSLSGDNMLARVNSREMILNLEQQSRLFKIANGEGASRPQIIRNEITVKVEEREIAKAMYDSQVNGWVR